MTFPALRSLEIVSHGRRASSRAVPLRRLRSATHTIGTPRRGRSIGRAGGRVKAGARTASTQQALRRPTREIVEETLVGRGASARAVPPAAPDGKPPMIARRSRFARDRLPARRFGRSPRHLRRAGALANGRSRELHGGAASDRDAEMLRFGGALEAESRLGSRRSLRKQPDRCRNLRKTLSRRKIVGRAATLARPYSSGVAAMSSGFPKPAVEETCLRRYSTLLRRDTGRKPEGRSGQAR